MKLVDKHKLCVCITDKIIYVYFFYFFNTKIIKIWRESQKVKNLVINLTGHLQKHC